MWRRWKAVLTRLLVYLRPYECFDALERLVGRNSSSSSIPKSCPDEYSSSPSLSSDIGTPSRSAYETFRWREAIRGEARTRGLDQRLRSRDWMSPLTWTLTEDTLPLRRRCIVGPLVADPANIPGTHELNRRVRLDQRCEETDSLNYRLHPSPHPRAASCCS